MNLNLKSVNLDFPFMNLELNFDNADKELAYQIFVEINTRIASQPLDDESGDEDAALNSLYKLFCIIREEIKKSGVAAHKVGETGMKVLNDVLRPFTSKYHKIKEQKGFSDKETCDEFRSELRDLQEKMQEYIDKIRVVFA